MLFGSCELQQPRYRESCNDNVKAMLMKYFLYVFFIKFYHYILIGRMTLSRGASPMVTQPASRGKHSSIKVGWNFLYLHKRWISTNFVQLYGFMFALILYLVDIIQCYTYLCDIIHCYKYLRNIIHCYKYLGDIIHCYKYVSDIIHC